MKDNPSKDVTVAAVAATKVKDTKRKGIPTP